MGWMEHDQPSGTEEFRQCIPERRGHVIPWPVVSFQPRHRIGTELCVGQQFAHPSDESLDLRTQFVSVQRCRGRTGFTGGKLDTFEFVGTREEGDMACLGKIMIVSCNPKYGHDRTT